MEIKKALALLIVLGLLLITCYACGIWQADKTETKQDTSASEATPSTGISNSESAENTGVSNTEETQNPQETDNSETEPTTTEPSSVEPSTTYPPATEPAKTEPPTTEPTPVETEPLETNSPETKPPATEPEPTEPPVTEAPTKTYKTAWGTRPYEFEEVCHYVLDEYLMIVMHWDRYGNVWYDHTNSKTNGFGKSIWTSAGQSSAIPIYFGNGRWSNFNVYWTEDGESGGTTDWRWGQGYYYPSNWGNDYEYKKSPCPYDTPILNLANGAKQFLAALEAGGEVGELMQKELGLTDEQVEAIINDPTTIPLPSSGYIG